MIGAFIETDEDIHWLKEMHLKGVTLPSKYANFKFAVLQGNEDAPYAVNLYTTNSPNYDDDYFRVNFDVDRPIYCECAEYNGKTGKHY